MIFSINDMALSEFSFKDNKIPPMGCELFSYTQFEVNKEEGESAPTKIVLSDATTYSENNIVLGKTLFQLAMTLKGEELMREHIFMCFTMFQDFATAAIFLKSKEVFRPPILYQSKSTEYINEKFINPFWADLTESRRVRGKSARIRFQGNNQDDQPKQPNPPIL